MGWKRFEKEIKKAGKSVEDEGKRVLNRIVPRPTTDSATSQPSTSSSIGQQIPAVCASVGGEEHKEINVNPNGLKPGRAYIINHLNFNDPKLRTRTGSEADVQRLKAIFRKFRMKVKLISDATVSDVRAAMEKITSYDFRKVSCLAIVIMSHGHECNQVAAKDGIYSLDYDIMYKILRNPSLTSKLKLLITQACKGPVNPLHLEIEGPRPRPTTVPSEILQLNSCVEGYVSFIDPTHGSPFIATLCNHLENSGLENDILSIANKVVADVKTQYGDIQIPMVHTNLTKQFVFGHYVSDDREAESNASCSSEDETDLEV